MDTSALVDGLKAETDKAIEYKSAEKAKEDPDAIKIPEFHRIMGANGRNLAVNLPDSAFTELGIAEDDFPKVREVGVILRDAFVSKYGDVSTTNGFDSKPGTKVVATLKALLELPSEVTDISLEDRQAITEAMDSWYENAPLRGRAANVKNQGKDDAENAPEVETDPSTDVETDTENVSE